MPRSRERGCALFDDLGNDDHVVALRRSVFERGFDGKPGLCDVIGPDVEDRETVRGRFDAGDIDFFQLLDVGEDVAKLRGELGFLLGGERESRERRDVVNVEVGGGGHGDYFRIW